MNNIFNNFGRKISWVQLLFLFCIILLAASALLSSEEYSSRCFAIPLFAVGAATVIICAIKKRTLKGSMWLLLDGAATTALSTLLLSGISLPFSFALWELALGCLKMTEAFRFKADSAINNRIFLFIGIAEIMSGTAFIIRTADPTAQYNSAIVIALSIQMSAYALRYYFYPLVSED